MHNFKGSILPGLWYGMLIILYLCDLKLVANVYIQVLFSFNWGKYESWFELKIFKEICFCVLLIEI